MIKVGDIVVAKNKEGKTCKAVILKKYDTAADMLFSDATFGYRGDGKYATTGKHIDIQSVLDAIK